MQCSVEVDADCVVLSEHKLKDTEINLVKVQSYTVKSVYCHSGCGGGRVMVLCKSGVRDQKLDFPRVKQSYQETLWAGDVISPTYSSKLFQKKF